MHALLELAISEIPEEFLRTVAEQATTCTAEAYKQAARTPEKDPTYRSRLGDHRYRERNEMIRRAVEATRGLGVGQRHGQHKSYIYPIATVGRFLISHAKVERWNDPIEAKDYKKDLAENNPTSGQQLPLFAVGEAGNAIYALIVVQYPLPENDQSLPRQVGFGIPTQDLTDWVVLIPLDEMFALYSNASAPLVDKAKPVLKRRRKSHGEADEQ